MVNQDTGDPGNQSNLLADARSWHEAWETGCARVTIDSGFYFLLDDKVARGFFLRQPVAYCSKTEVRGGPLDFLEMVGDFEKQYSTTEDTCTKTNFMHATTAEKNSHTFSKP